MLLPGQMMNQPGKTSLLDSSENQTKLPVFMTGNAVGKHNLLDLKRFELVTKLALFV